MTKLRWAMSVAVLFSSLLFQGATAMQDQPSEIQNLSISDAHDISCAVDEMFGRTFFFGDSTTAHLAVRGGIPRERVWSGEGNTMLYTDVLSQSVKIDGEKFSLWDAAKRYRPRVLIITIGASGGAGFLSEARFKSIYRTLIENVMSAAPDTKIIVQSIFPLSDRSKKYYKRLTREAVITANRWIKSVCDDVGVPYLDTHSLLCDKNGYLKPHFQNDEYLHLTSAAYDVILGNIRAYIAQNINDLTA